MKDLYSTLKTDMASSKSPALQKSKTQSIVEDDKSQSKKKLSTQIAAESNIGIDDLESMSSEARLNINLEERS